MSQKQTCFPQLQEATSGDAMTKDHRSCDMQNGGNTEQAGLKGGLTPR